jgi:hypothetical protein
VLDGIPLAGGGSVARVAEYEDTIDALFRDPELTPATEEERAVGNALMSVNEAYLKGVTQYAGQSTGLVEDRAVQSAEVLEKLNRFIPGQINDAREAFVIERAIDFLRERKNEYVTQAAEGRDLAIAV